jgi:hypothetical protein
MTPMKYNSERLKKNLRLQAGREKAIMDILTSIYKEYHVSVYTITRNNTLEIISNIEGLKLIRRPRRKGPDFVIMDGHRILRAWEVANLRQTSYLKWNKVYNYIRNLERYNCARFLVLSYPSNLRKVHPEKSEEFNIENTEKLLARHHIFLIYMEYQDPEAVPDEEEVIAGLRHQQTENCLIYRTNQFILLNALSTIQNRPETKTNAYTTRNLSQTCSV